MFLLIFSQGHRRPSHATFKQMTTAVLPLISHRPCLLQMLLKLEHVFTLVDPRLHFKPHSLPIMLNQGIETLQDT